MGQSNFRYADVYLHKILTVTGATTLSSTLAVTGISTLTGALVVDDTTDATSSAGSIQTDGGISMAKKLYVGTGITIGASTTAINFSGAATNNMVVTTVPTGADGSILKAGVTGTHLDAASAGGQIHLFVDNAATSGNNRVVMIETLSSGASTTLKNYALRGTAGIKTGVTSASGAWCIGLQGKVVSAGTLSAGCTAAAVLAQINNSGTFAAGSLLYGCWIDNQLATNPATDTFWMLGITQTIATVTPKAMIRLYGGASAVFDVEVTGGAWANATASCTTQQGMLKVTVAGSTRYIPLYTGYTG